MAADAAAAATTTATATTTTAADRKKSVFRKALTALRYAVAATVTVVVVMTAVYAFHVVARTDELNIYVVDGYVSVNQTTLTEPPKLSFALSVDNPSGRVRFYYTGISCVLDVNDSSIAGPSTFYLEDMIVAPDSELQVDTEANFSTTNKLALADLFFENRTMDGNLTLFGNLTVGVYSAYNKTRVPTTYYCRYVTVGDVNGSSSTGVYWTSCQLANEKKRIQNLVTTVY